MGLTLLLLSHASQEMPGVTSGGAERLLLTGEEALQLVRGVPLSLGRFGGDEDRGDLAAFLDEHIVRRSCVVLHFVAPNENLSQ